MIVFMFAKSLICTVQERQRLWSNDFGKEIGCDKISFVYSDRYSGVYGNDGRDRRDILQKRTAVSETFIWEDGGSVPSSLP